MSKYKVGDKVRITTDKSRSDCWNDIGEMDKWLGEVMTIRCVGLDTYSMEEDRMEHFGDGWFWYEEMIDGLADEVQEAPKEMVHHPSHYQLHKHECIEEMIALFGIEAVIGFCKCNIHKYRYRQAGKDGERDLHKADEYMDILLDLEKRRDEY